MTFPEQLQRFPQPARGWVKKPITSTQPGRVKYQATYWPAELEASMENVTLHPDDAVEVIARRGIVLIVKPYISK